IAALARVKNYVDTGAFLAIQAAGAAVLPQAEQLAREYVAQFRARRDAMLPVLRAQGFEPETPRATMYLWVPLPEGLPSATFQRKALEEEGVVVLPGSGFGTGGEGFFRVALTVAAPAPAGSRPRGRHDHAATRADGGQAGHGARREFGGGGPAHREPAPGGGRAPLGVAATCAPRRGGRRPLWTGGAQGLGRGAPAALH